MKSASSSSSDSSSDEEEDSSSSSDEEEKAKKQEMESREMKKIQYYAQLFQKQEAMEARKRQRKEAKNQKKSNTDVFVKQRFQGRKKTKKVIEEPLKIELVKDVSPKAVLDFEAKTPELVQSESQQNQTGGMESAVNQN